MGKRIKILHVVGGLNAGGIESLIVGLMRVANPAEVSFDFVKHVPDCGIYEKDIVRLGGNIFEAPQYRVINHSAYIAWWNRFFSEHRDYDIVHGHIRSTASIYLNIAKHFGLSTVAHSHATSDGLGFSSMVKAIMYRGISSCADSRLACSHEAGRWLFGESFPTKSNDCIFPNAIDVSSFSFDENLRTEVRSSLHLEEDVFLFGHVGRFVGQKNHAFLLQVFASIHAENRNTALMLVGDGPLRPAIEVRVRELGLFDCVHLMGQQIGIGSLYCAMDALILPSSKEGFGNVLVEGQACGLRCLASTGVPKMTNVLDLVSYIPISDGVAKWKDASLSLIESRVGRGLREAASQRISETEYEIHNAYEKLIRIYRALEQAGLAK